MKRLFLPIFLIAFVVSAFGQDARDRTARISNISKLSATNSGDRGTFSVSSVETLNAGQFSVGIGWDNFDRTPRDLDINSVPIFVSYGISERVTITASLDAMKQVVARNLPQTGFFNRLPFVGSRYESGVGDAMFRVKYRLQRKADNVGGMSLSSFVKFPNAEAARGLGTGRIDAGLELGFTSLLPLNILMHSTTGVLATSDTKTATNKETTNEVRTNHTSNTRDRS